MDSKRIVTRIFNLKEDYIEIIRSKAILDFKHLSDYEEYKGELYDGKTKMCLVLCEYVNTSEYKIILYDFDLLHREYTDWIRYMESLEGIIKNN